MSSIDRPDGVDLFMPFAAMKSQRLHRSFSHIAYTSFWHKRHDPEATLPLSVKSHAVASSPGPVFELARGGRSRPSRRPGTTFRSTLEFRRIEPTCSNSKEPYETTKRQLLKMLPRSGRHVRKDFRTVQHQEQVPAFQAHLERDFRSRRRSDSYLRHRVSRARASVGWQPVKTSVRRMLRK